MIRNTNYLKSYYSQEKLERIWQSFHDFSASPDDAYLHKHFQFYWTFVDSMEYTSRWYTEYSPEHR